MRPDPGPRREPTPRPSRSRGASAGPSVLAGGAGLRRCGRSSPPPRIVRDHQAGARHRVEGGGSLGSARRPFPRPVRKANARGRDGHVGGRPDARQDRDLTDVGQLGHDARLGDRLLDVIREGLVQLLPELPQLPVIHDQGEDGRLVGVLRVDDDPLADRDPPVARLAARGLLEERVDAFGGIAAEDVRHDEDPAQVRAIEQLADVGLLAPLGPSPRDRRPPPPPGRLCRCRHLRCVVDLRAARARRPPRRSGPPAGSSGVGVGRRGRHESPDGLMSVLERRTSASRVAMRSGTPRPRRWPREAPARWPGSPATDRAARTTSTARSRDDPGRGRPASNSRTPASSCNSSASRGSVSKADSTSSRPAGSSSSSR